MKELGLYIHIPFCKRKCYYCDFISFAGKEEKIENYINSLIKEIDYKLSKLKENELITTIYIGGGTPSYINYEYIKRILDTIKKYIDISKIELTLEVNPGTVDREKLKRYLEIGINRLSIGLQSTNNKILQKLGRIHTYEEFLLTYNTARQIGFKNINIDLILGVPNQTIEILKKDIENVVKLNPEHISIYSLIVEEHTKLEKMINSNKLQLPEEDLEREMYWETKKYLEKNGYIHYEISNFAKKGSKSKHNFNCWEQKEYLGCGIASHSYYNNKRFCNINNIDEYIDNLENNKISKNIIVNEIQTKEDKEKEYMLLALRKIDGVNITKFKNKFVDNPIYVFRNELNKLINEGLVEIYENNIKLTNKGLDLANLVWEEFVG